VDVGSVRCDLRSGVPHGSIVAPYVQHNSIASMIKRRPTVQVISTLDGQRAAAVFLSAESDLSQRSKARRKTEFS
jgi:hypothetical protein